MKDYKFLNLPVIAYVFFLALFLRAYNLGVPGIWVDEAFSIWLAKFSLPELLRLVSMDAHPPLYFVLLHYWIKLFGSSEFAARSLSVIFSLGTVILIYYLCNAVFVDKKYGILSSLLFSVSSFAIIMIDTDVKMYSLLMFLTTLSVYLLVRIINVWANGRSPIRMVLWILYIFVLILLLYTHYFAFFIIIAQLIYIVLFYKNNVGAKGPSPLLIILILLIAFLPWNNAFFQQMFIFNKGEHLPKPGIFYIAQNFSEFLIKFPLKTLFPQEACGVYAIFSLIFILTVLAIVKLLKEKRAQAVILTFLLVIAFSILISWVSNKKQIFQARYVALIYPFFVIILSYALINLKNKYLKYFLIALYIISNLAAYGLYVTDSKYWKQDWRAVAKYADERAKPGDIIILQFSYNVFPFNYYYKNGLIKIRVVCDKFDARYSLEEPDEYIAKGGVGQVLLDKLDENYLLCAVNKYDKVIHVLNSEKLSDPDNEVLKWLNKNCNFLEGVEVENYYGGQSRITIGVFRKKE